MSTQRKIILTGNKELPSEGNKFSLSSLNSSNILEKTGDNLQNTLTVSIPVFENSGWDLYKLYPKLASCNEKTDFIVKDFRKKTDFIVNDFRKKTGTIASIENIYNFLVNKLEGIFLSYKSIFKFDDFISRFEITTKAFAEQLNIKYKTNNIMSLSEEIQQKLEKITKNSENCEDKDKEILEVVKDLNKEMKIIIEKTELLGRIDKQIKDLKTKIDLFLDTYDFEDNIFEKLKYDNGFKDIVSTIKSKNIYDFEKTDIVLLFAAIRNIFDIYLPIILLLIDIDEKDIKKINMEKADLYFEFEGILKKEEGIDFMNFEKTLLFILEKLETLVSNREKITTLENIGNQLNISNFVDIYSKYDRKFNNLKNIVFLAEKGLLNGLKLFLENNNGGLKEYIGFVDNRFFKEYPKLVEIVDYSNLDFYKEKLFNRKGNLSNKEKAFALQYGFLEKDDKTIKSLLFLSKNTELTEKELAQLTDEQIKILEKNYTLPKEYIQKIIDGEDIESVIAQYEIEKYKQEIQNKLSYIPQIDGFTNIISKIDNLLEELDTENFDKKKKEVEQIWEQNLDPIYKKIEKLISYNILDLNDIHKFINVLLEKKTKKNGLKLSNILEVLDYLFSTYDKQEVEFVFNLLNKSNLQISSDFLTNYKNIFKTILSNSNIVNNILESKKSLSLSEIYELLNKHNNEKYAKDLINTYFPESLSKEVYEIYKESKDKFNKLVTIAKLIKNKDDEDFYLELMVLDEINFKKFYFLVKNLNILGIDISGKYKELFNLVDKLSEDKLKNLKKILKERIYIDFDKDFFYDLLIDYITIEGLDVSIFDVLFIEEENIEEDDVFEKNTGISGLAGFSGQDIISKLKKLGFEVKRIKGSHYMMYNKKIHQYTVVPYHKQVKAKLLYDMLNRLKIKKEKFLEL